MQQGNSKVEGGGRARSARPTPGVEQTINNEWGNQHGATSERSEGWCYPDNKQRKMWMCVSQKMSSYESEIPPSGICHNDKQRRSRRSRQRRSRFKLKIVKAISHHLLFDLFSCYYIKISIIFLLNSGPAIKYHDETKFTAVQYSVNQHSSSSAQAIAGVAGILLVNHNRRWQIVNLTECLNGMTE